MPYLHTTFKSVEEFEAQLYRPVQFAIDVKAALVTIEWWASSFTDPGPDYNLFLAKDATGKTLQAIREKGF